MTDLGHPETLFATAGQYRVAYRMSGAGPPDVVMTPGLWSHMELIREDPGHVNFRRRMQSFSRQIGFDSLGTGLSDRPTGGSAVEYWIESCAAVLDAAHSPAAVIVSLFGSAPLVLEFLNRYPQRCSGLVFINTHACWAARPGYAAGAPPEEIAKTREFMAKAWGRTGFPVPSASSQAGNAEFLLWSATIQRAMASPSAVLEGLAELEALDSRPILPQIRVPTLVIARTGLAPGAFARARYIADHIAHAEFVEVPGSDVAPFYETPELILDSIEEFIKSLE
jgi:pimeloyl-ACP methyl ester carboxylesterase